MLNYKLKGAHATTSELSVSTKDLVCLLLVPLHLLCVCLLWEVEENMQDAFINNCPIALLELFVPFP